MHYVMNDRLYVRGWPSHYRDANTPTQRAQRGKMAQVCRVLPHLKTLFSEGYKPLQKRNGRRIGSYHVAVSTALREWFVNSPGGARLDTSKLQLTEGIHALPRQLSAERAPGGVLIQWGKALSWRSPKLLLAARNADSDEWLTCTANIEGLYTLCATLPDSWRHCKVDIWIAFAADSQRVLTATRYASLGPAPASPTGGLHTPSSPPTVTPTAAPPSGKKTHTHAPKPIAVPPRPNCCACRFGLRDAYCTGVPGTTLSPQPMPRHAKRQAKRPPNPNRAPLNLLQGSVGQAVFSSWRQQPYVKSKSKQPKSPATARQAARQRAFAARARCASRLLPAFKAGWKHRVPLPNAFKFLMQQLHNASTNPQQLRLAAGEYHGPQGLKLSVQASQATISWRGPKGNPNDRLYAAIISHDMAYAASRCVPLTSQNVVFNLPSSVTADFGYAFITDASGTSVSESVCVKKEI